MKKIRQLNVIELFSGAGGLALGLEKAGFNTLSLIDSDKDSCKTLKLNRPNWNVLNEDIVKIAEDNLLKKFNLKDGELDLLSGGFPCQAFSYAGHGMGFEDTRGTLFYQFGIFLKKLKPKMFIAENVKGLISHNKGNTFKTMLNAFNEIGYYIKYKLLNAWDYSVPQKRERVFIIGIRNDLREKINFTFPKPHNYKPILKDVLINVPKSPGQKYSEKKENIMKLIPEGGCWTSLPENIAKSYMKSTYYSSGGRRGIARRLSMDEPSLTLTTSPAMKQTERCHPKETRPLTIREYARIQTFPDSWKFFGGICSIYRQIGNAVPVNLAKSIGEELKKSLQGKIYNEMATKFYKKERLL